MTGWIGLGDDPPPGHHEPGEVRRDVGWSRDDADDLADDLAALGDLHDRTLRDEMDP